MSVIEFEKWKARKEEEALYRKVVDLTEFSGEISISAIQREFKVVYSCAEAIMRRMEEEGFIDPSKDS